MGRITAGFVNSSLALLANSTIWAFLETDALQKFYRSPRTTTSGTPILRAVDFFCGAGGMSFGLARSGLNVIAGLDVDVFCGPTYEHNVRGASFMACDVSELKTKTLSVQLGLQQYDDSLLLTGCSPCQYWSKINTDRSKSRQSAFLLKEFTRFVDDLRPGWVIVENVPGLVNKDGSALPEFLKFLARRGYDFAHAVLDLSHYQVPQTRHRFVLIANRVGVPASLPSPSSRPVPTVRSFIGVENGFPTINAGHRDSTAFIHTASGLSEVNLERIKRTPADGGRRDCWQVDAKLQVAAYQGRENQFADVYSRMSWDKPSPTITTRFNSFSNGRFGHPEEHRAISLREGATLQTFPKSFRFFGSMPAIARQIGNAVPPAFAKQIGQHVLAQHLSIMSHG